MEKYIENWIFNRSQCFSKIGIYKINTNDNEFKNGNFSSYEFKTKDGLRFRNEKDFYFCGRTPMEDRVYCKLHVLHAYQPKGFKGDEDKGPEELPNFIEKKVKKRVKSA